jgi:cobaltochelatase CobN
LAVHRWIEREFKADVIVHWGTHALHEFTPGKGCGLSEECYPEISLGKVPHLYVYCINNPMEGTTAKRRGYATVIDHLTPVMAPTKTYDELSELEELLSQHAKAKAMDDTARLKILLEQIVEKSKQANLFKEFSDMDEFVDYLHGKINLFKETQFRDGLHILGEAPKEKGLVNLLVGMLRYDAGRHPSIRRVVLESMGLDYNDVVDNPQSFHKELGKTNAEILSEATEICIKIIQETLKEVELK